MLKFAGEKRPRETPDSNGIDLDLPARRGFTPAMIEPKSRPAGISAANIR
jgi:hypothetical protein